MLNEISLHEPPVTGQMPGITPDQSAPIDIDAIWLDLICVATLLCRIEQQTHGMVPVPYMDQPVESQRGYLWAALAATGSVDQVREDVARHLAIGAMKEHLAEFRSVPLSVFQKIDHEFCRRGAERVMWIQRSALEGLITNQPVIRDLVQRIGTLRETRQITATTEPGGRTVTMTAEVAR